MIGPNPHYSPAAAATGSSRGARQTNTFPTLVNRSDRTRVSLEELRQHRQHDVDQWHHEIGRLRRRARAAVGIAMATVLASIATLWLTADHRASPPAYAPTPTTSRLNVTGGGAG